MNNEYRTDTLLALALHLSENLKIEALSEALTAAYGIGSFNSRANALTNLLPHLPEELKAWTLIAILQIRILNVYIFNEDIIPLLNMIPPLSDDLKAQMLTDTCKINDEDDRVHILLQLAPYLPDNIKNRLLSVTDEIRDRSN